MAITAAAVKALRDLTGAGMMDCKKALTATDGDNDKAIEWLREKGLATAQKKAGRIAAEGKVVTALSDDEKTAAILEVNCETDFAADTDKFKAYAAALVQQVLDHDYKDLDEFLNDKSELNPDQTVAEVHQSKIAEIGENLTIRRFEKVTTEGLISSYLHAGGKIGVLVVADTDADSSNENVKTALKDVAMQVAAMHPKYNTEADVEDEFKEHELGIFREEVAQDPKFSGKPEKVRENIVTGKWNKELKEICLQDQEFIKAENKENVKAYLAKVAKDNGVSLNVTRFVRFETGEGIEKKNEDFAAEVASQMK